MRRVRIKMTGLTREVTEEQYQYLHKRGWLKPEPVEESLDSDPTPGQENPPVVSPLVQIIKEYHDE